jgi:3-methyladenine DNA glycosylase/8-oxoguanine DNA glycosylase
VEPDELRTHHKLGYRAPYSVELSQAVAAGRLELEALAAPHLPTDEVRKALLAIKGVGDYAAANMLLLLGHHDYVPVDSAAIKSVGDMWHNGARVGPKEIYAAFDAWRPYRGLAYWFWNWD